MTSVVDQDLIGRIEAARARIRAMGPAVAAGVPWRLSDRIGIEPEASWGPQEVLAHVSEMVPFWHGEIERVLATPGDAAGPFGRTADDTIRIGLIERERRLPPHELVERIDASLERLIRRLKRLDESDGERRAQHRTRGERSLADFIRIFLVDHLEEHVGQLDNVLRRDR